MSDDSISDDSRGRKAHCYEDLKQQILTQALEPGSDIDEVTLARTYRISRPPLREVLRQLAGEGYVVLRKNRGAIVAPMTHKTLRNFFVVAPMVYSAVSRLAAVNATSSQIDRLKAVQMQFRAAIRDGDVCGRALLNERFHAVIGEMAANEFLEPSLRRLLIDHTRIGMAFYDPRNARMAESREIAVEHHEQFIATIEAGDADAAAGIAVAHWELSRAEIELFVTPPSMDIPLGPLPGLEQIRERA